MVRQSRQPRRAAGRSLRFRGQSIASEQAGKCERSESDASVLKKRAAIESAGGRLLDWHGGYQFLVIVSFRFKIARATVVQAANSIASKSSATGACPMEISFFASVVRDS